MAIDEKKFQPGQVSTDIIRGTTKSLKVVSKIDSATTIASKSQNISANNN